MFDSVWMHEIHFIGALKVWNHGRFKERVLVGASPVYCTLHSKHCQTLLTCLIRIQPLRHEDQVWQAPTLLWFWLHRDIPEQVLCRVEMKVDRISLFHDAGLMFRRLWELRATGPAATCWPTNSTLQTSWRITTKKLPIYWTMASM